MNSNRDNRVIVGMSGGVDSAVAALLLCRQGHAVEALFMDNWDDGEDETYCSAAADFQDARQVCEELQIPLHRVSFAAEYRERVFRHFLDEYVAGRTPNPDVLCNSEIKFKAFLDYAMRLGANRIATGHYARTGMHAGRVCLLRARDTGKDQTYFLHSVPGAAIARSLFPLGGLLKREVRALARDAGFDNFRKKDSTGICFIGERPFREFLGTYLPAAPGEIRTADGTTLGTHRGLMYYTIGQRQGLGIGGCRGSESRPWYVIDKNLEHNQLIVAQGHDHPALLHNVLEIRDMHWIADQPAPNTPGLTARIRYRQPDQLCELDRISADRWRIRFAEPQWGVTPGQYAVIYHGECCLGGGVIHSRELQSCRSFEAAAASA